MKIVHWTMRNNSGMHRVAEQMVNAEKAMDLNSHLGNLETKEGWDECENADVHVVHTHFPDEMRGRATRPLKLVWIGHGTPEHCFQSAVETGQRGNYGASDSFMLLQYWLQHADAAVTFWPRHQAIYQSLSDKGRVVHCIPLGIDKSFWQPVPSQGRYTGNPSILSCENPHYIKWPLDLVIAWPWVVERLAQAKLHLAYMVRDQHRWFFPLMNRNGSSFSAYVMDTVLAPDHLRNAFVSCDYFIGLVRYGDFNLLSLEASACGVKTISYAGNEHADFWVPEGDQRQIAETLVPILQGKIEPREGKASVPEIAETARAMQKVYEGIL